MKSRVVTMVFCLLLSGGAAAQILPPMEGYSAQVEFSRALEDRMTSINNLEQRLEERFRDDRHYAQSPREAGTQRFAASRTAGTEWAGERLIGKVSDFTLDKLVKANLVIDTTVSTSHTGPELAFVETDPSKRVGPTLAYFVKRALQQAWPQHEDGFVGPTIVRISGPNERVMNNPD